MTSVENSEIAETCLASLDSVMNRADKRFEHLGNEDNLKIVEHVAVTILRYN